MTITSQSITATRNSLPRPSGFIYLASNEGTTITINTILAPSIKPVAPNINQVHSAAFFDSWADEWGDDEDYPA